MSSCLAAGLQFLWELQIMAGQNDGYIESWVGIFGIFLGKCSRFFFDDLSHEVHTHIP